MSKRDYYDILGIKRDASKDDLKKAYRNLARKWHPDRNKNPNAASKFSEIQEAYDTLSDDTKRRNYDQFGHAGAHQQGFRPDPRTGASQSYTWSSQGGSPFGQAGGADFGGGADIGSIFEGLFGGGRSRTRAGRQRPGGAQAAAARGSDVQHTLQIAFETALSGGKESLRLAMGDQQQSIDVTIPKGIDDGAKLRVRGKGAGSQFGGQPGDLILTIKIAPHPWFRRDGKNISIDLPLTMAEAALGTSVDVPTPKGTVTLRIPPGTSSGKKLRIAGQGVEDQAGKKGDFFAVISIQAPTDLTEQQRRAIESLAEGLPSPRTGPPWTN